MVAWELRELAVFCCALIPFCLFGCSTHEAQRRLDRVYRSQSLDAKKLSITGGKKDIIHPSPYCYNTHTEHYVVFRRIYFLFCSVAAGTDLLYRHSIPFLSEGRTPIIIMAKQLKRFHYCSIFSISRFLFKSHDFFRKSLRKKKNNVPSFSRFEFDSLLHFVSSVHS